MQGLRVVLKSLKHQDIFRVLATLTIECKMYPRQPCGFRENSWEALRCSPGGRYRHELWMIRGMQRRGGRYMYKAE